MSGKPTSTREKAMKMLKDGMTVREIANALGLTYNSIYSYKREFESQEGGWNADRHLCTTCEYRLKNYGCDYYLITDKPRGCDPEKCTKYKKRKTTK